MHGHTLSGHGTGCPTCTSGVPPLSNPFEDDPQPAAPEPSPESDVRNHPAWKSPQHITRDPRPSSQARATLPRTSVARQTQPVAAARPAARTQATEQSVLRRTSLETPVEPAEFEVPKAMPIPAAAPIVESDDYWAGVPRNPLRAK
jgi:hypothetical protein